MRLLITLITYNRLNYTQKTLASLWDNTSDLGNYFLVVVDNHSTDGTQDYLISLKKRGRINGLILNDENYFPGKACNMGWDFYSKTYEPTHLMRLDNDMQFSKGWDKKVEEYFAHIPELGQLGVEHEAIECPEAEFTKRVINGYAINEWPGCVGGPMVIPRKLYDKGMRYDEKPWEPPAQEDSELSKRIKECGYLVGHAQEELGRTFANKSNWADHAEYYHETFKARGIEDRLGNI